MWLQSAAESSTHSCTALAGLIAASWWFNLHIFLSSACLSISFISILQINLSLVPSAGTGWGQCLYIFHCNLGSLKCNILTEIVPALHHLLLEILLIFWCMLRQLIMDKAWVYQETSVEPLLWWNHNLLWFLLFVYLKYILHSLLFPLQFWASWGFTDVFHNNFQIFSLISWLKQILFCLFFCLNFFFLILL